MNFTFETTNESLKSPFKDSFFINDRLSAVSLINHVINSNGGIKNFTNKAYFCSFVQYLISDIDKKIETLLNKIIHLQPFMKLEASWKGLFILAKKIENDKKLKIKILSASWEELSNDFSKATEFDQSAIFQKIYSLEFGSPGGEPYGIILGDYEIFKGNPSKMSQDIRILEQLSMVAAASFCPFITSINSNLLNLESFNSLRFLKSSPNIEGVVGISWQRLRKSPDSRFLGLIGPKTLYRIPYNLDSKTSKKLIFEESFNENGEGYPFGNPIYPFGSLIIAEYVETGWLSGLRGCKENELGGGLINDLPYEASGIDSTKFSEIHPIECIVTNQMEQLFDLCGIMTYSPAGFGHELMLHNCPSIHIPEKYTKDIANQNSQISSLLNYILCVSRFAHYIKIIGRDKVGSFKTPEECETFTNNWLQKFCSSTISLSNPTPLRFGKVEVSENPSKPGTYSSTIHLQPHMQIDQIYATIKLVTIVDA